MQDNMRKVEVLTKDLREAITANRAKHEAAYIRASEEWTVDMCKAAADLQSDPTDKALVNALIVCNNGKPSQYLDEYDKAAKQLEYEQRTTLELDQQEFNALVCDEWSWTRQFISNAYTSKLHK
jgi:hypothetical protein